MLDNPVCSTNNIWREDDQNRALTNDLISIETSIENLITSKAPAVHTHDTFIQSLNKSYTATVSNGSATVVVDNDFDYHTTCLIAIQHTTSNGLVGRSLYSWRFDPNKVVQSTLMLSECKNGSDSLMIVWRDDQLTFSVSYTGTGSPTSATFKIL